LKDEKLRAILDSIDDKIGKQISDKERENNRLIAL
jgi:hypothetical protein